MNLNKYAKQCHQANIKWWQDINTGERIERNKGELICLMITELAEAYEGVGKMDDKLPNRRQFEVELADCLIRIFDYCGGFDIDLSSCGFIELKDATSFTDWSHRLPDCRDQKNPPCLMDVVSVLSSAMETIRKGGYEAQDMALAIQWICMLGRGFDLQGAFDEKMAFNAQRHDHTHEARRAEGGKKA